MYSFMRVSVTLTLRLHSELKLTNPDRVKVVQCVAADVKGIATMTKVIEQCHGRVDVVISNTGVS